MTSRQVQTNLIDRRVVLSVPSLQLAHVRLHPAPGKKVAVPPGWCRLAIEPESPREIVAAWVDNDGDLVLMVQDLDGSLFPVDPGLVQVVARYDPLDRLRVGDVVIGE